MFISSRCLIDLGSTFTCLSVSSIHSFFAIVCFELLFYLIPETWTVIIEQNRIKFVNVQVSITVWHVLYI